MAKLFERSVLTALGAAAVASETIEALARELVRSGNGSAGEAPSGGDELAGRIIDEARQLKGRLNDITERAFREAGFTSNQRFDDMELKLAQLEHRLSLLEKAAREEAAGSASDGPAGE